MSRLLRSSLAVALLLVSVITIGLAHNTQPASAGSGLTVHLPLVANGLAPFALQPGSPTYLSNFLNTSGCNWFGIVGRAFGSDDNPVINLTVHLEGGGINADALTGAGPSAIGPGGYQIQISDHPIATSGVYFIELRRNDGSPLSTAYMIPTYADCSQNLIMVNFLQRS